MNTLYQTIVHDRRHFEVLAPNKEIAETIVERLKPKLDLRQTYKMSEFLPEVPRLYHGPINNRPAVEVRVSRKEDGILFDFRQASDKFPEDITELARILHVDLQAQANSRR